MKITRSEADLQELKSVLLEMEADPSFVTKSAFRANKEIWPDNRISFIDNHLSYLKSHPQVNLDHYISNLRLMLGKNTRRGF